MDFKVILEGESEAKLYKKKEFEELMGFEYLPRLRSLDEKIDHKVARRVSKARAKGWFTQEQKWLAAFYAKEMECCSCPSIEIRWIGNEIGCGVFAAEPIARHAFIGEYTGILRHRKRFREWKNDYCFEYDLGELFRSSFLIDAEPAGNHTRFINHSDEPNLEPISILWEDRMHIILRAARRIEKGEELGYDYGEEYWKKRTKR